MTNNVYVELGETIQSLRLDLVKQEILNRSRSDRIAELETLVSQLTNTVCQREQKIDQLEHQLSDCLTILDNVNGENRELTIKNKQVVELEKQLETFKSLSEQYHSLMKKEQCSPLLARGIYYFPKRAVFLAKQTQTDSQLNFSKYTQS